jgi:hypothetical protein
MTGDSRSTVNRRTLNPLKLFHIRRFHVGFQETDYCSFVGRADPGTDSFEIPEEPVPKLRNDGERFHPTGGFHDGKGSV